MWPQTGDILVSNPRSTLEHEVSIVPALPHLTCPNHDTAVAQADALARARQVDVWLTEDQTHFLRLASYRHTERA
jgi:hypothetical protein